MSGGGGGAASYTGRQGVELAYLRSPWDEAATSFELFWAEAFVYLTALIGFVHAVRSSSQHALFFAIAFAAASFVDPFCLISEQIRNYFHSHASVLLWDRHVAPWQFPLFACIAYVPGAVVWQLGLPLLAETGLVIFAASWSFYCFDLFACRWLLYQWHVSDPLYAARTECVPLASSMWVTTYAGTASLLARLAYRYVVDHRKLRMPDAFSLQWWSLFAFCTVAFLPLHIVPISLFYFPSFHFKLDKEYEVVWMFGLAGLALAVGDYLISGPSKQNPPSFSFLVPLQSLVWLGALAYVILVLEPGDVVSTSVHQPYGGASAKTSSLCTQKESYLFGLSSRKRYVCDDDLVHWRIGEDLKTGLKPQPLDEWYTIRGLKMDDGFYQHYVGSLIAAVVIHVFLLAFGLLRMMKTRGGVKASSSKGGKEN